MRNLILPLAMNTILATAIHAQDPLKMTANWLAAHHQTLGPTAPPGWLMDLAADDLEIYVTAEQALVLVDRQPIFIVDGAAYLRKGLQGLGGTHMILIGEVLSVNDSVLRGTYCGKLSGTDVRIQQYVQVQHGVPSAIVRVISRVNGSAPAIQFDANAIAMSLLTKPCVTSEPALTRH